MKCEVWTVNGMAVPGPFYALNNIKVIVNCELWNEPAAISLVRPAKIQNS